MPHTEKNTLYVSVWGWCELPNNTDIFSRRTRSYCHVRLHNIAVLFAQMFCFRFSFVIVLVLVFSFVIVLVFVRSARCNFYFYIVFVSQIVIILVFVLIERSVIILVFVLVFVTKIALGQRGTVSLRWRAGRHFCSCVHWHGGGSLSLYVPASRMTYGARLPALTAWCGDTGRVPRRARRSPAADKTPADRLLHRRHILICYLLDVNALFDGDGTRCASPGRHATPPAHPSNYWCGTWHTVTLRTGRAETGNVADMGVYFQAHTHRHTVERSECQLTLSILSSPRVTVSHAWRTQLTNSDETARRPR